MKKQNGGASKCQRQGISRDGKLNPGRTGKGAGSPGIGRECAVRGEAFLESDRAFCPTPPCPVIPGPSYRSNLSEKTGLGFLMFLQATG